ncbi:MAG: cation:dicarboxylase symporter family transporter, partial [Elusimicrobia bacterium]|nr:cation:dicarboxylase symporter family transporter [Elusimicrobiota bacterium]
MPALRRLTAVSLSLALVLAQGQEALAAIRAVVPVKTGGAVIPAAIPAAAMAGVAGPRFAGTAGLSPRLAPTLSGSLTPVPIPLEPRTGPAASGLRATAVGAGLPASPAFLPEAAARRAAAEPIVPTPGESDESERLRASFSILQGLAAPDSAGGERTGRFAAAFDGALEKSRRGPADPVVQADPEAGRARPLPRLSAPVRKVPVEKGGGLKSPSPRGTPSSAWGFIKANRFLLAAGAGAAIGLAGVNLAVLPVLSLMPGLFFGALPWLAAPFIGLNVYKSFAHYSVVKESRTLLGFLVITAAGLAISAGVTMGMTAWLPVVDPASFAAAAIPGLGTGGFSPMQFMLPIIGLFTGAALLYKRARGVNDGSAQREYRPGWKGSLLRIYDQAVGLVVNPRTAPFLEKAGQLGEKGTELINKAFPRFIDIVGIPAVTVLLSMTMAAGGLGLLSAFGGYYVTAFAGMAVGFVALLAAYAAFGARGKDFKEILKAALFGFSISSSSATMPTEKETLKAMGVSRKTRDAVVPLGGVFNMFGTALYMGLTAFYALSMFGAAPTLAQYLNTALTVLVIAMGAPGIPASNITLLDPVLRQTGLQSGQISKVYTM